MSKGWTRFGCGKHGTFATTKGTFNIFNLDCFDCQQQPQVEIELGDAPIERDEPRTPAFQDQSDH